MYFYIHASFSHVISVSKTNYSIVRKYIYIYRSRFTITNCSKHSNIHINNDWERKVKRRSHVQTIMSDWNKSTYTQISIYFDDRSIFLIKRFQYVKRKYIIFLWWNKNYWAMRSNLNKLQTKLKKPLNHSSILRFFFYYIHRW